MEIYLAQMDRAKKRYPFIDYLISTNPDHTSACYLAASLRAFDTG